MRSSGKVNLVCFKAIGPLLLSAASPRACSPIPGSPSSLQRDLVERLVARPAGPKMTAYQSDAIDGPGGVK